MFSIISSCILNDIFCYKISTQSYPSIYGEKKIIKVILELLYLTLNKKGDSEKDTTGNKQFRESEYSEQGRAKNKVRSDICSPES